MKQILVVPYLLSYDDFYQITLLNLPQYFFLKKKKNNMSLIRLIQTINLGDKRGC